MSRFIIIDGKPHRWREILELRRAQLMASKTSDTQLALFETLREDYRPVDARTASGRYEQPSLF